MNILVTGSSGLVGSALIDQLTNNDKNYLKEIQFLKEKYQFIYLSSKNGDLRNIGHCHMLFQKFKPKVVIHLACNVGGLFKNTSKKIEMFSENLLINNNILQCCQYYKVELLVNMLSTCVFPDKIEYPLCEEKIHEGEPHYSNYGYAYMKRMLEVGSRLYHEEYGIKIINIIPTNIYGENDNFNLEDSHVIPALIHKCYLAKKNNTVFEVKGSGKPFRQFIFSKDLAQIILKLTKMSLKNECDKYLNIIASPIEEYAISEIVFKIADIFDFDKTNIKFEHNNNKFEQNNEQIQKTASNKKIVNLLKDFEFTDIEIGLIETIYWFKSRYPNLRL
jgi:GDP-L-fucose synthase